MAGVRGVRKSPTVSPPQFKEGLPDISVFSIGSPVCLECHVDGYPRPEVRWEKDGKAVMKSRNIHMIRSGDRCVLQIKNLQEKDLGRYECSAINIVGIAICKSHLRSSSSTVLRKADEKIFHDAKVSTHLRVPKHILPRSHSSERKRERRLRNNWRSSSVSINLPTTDMSPKEIPAEKTTIFERLSRVTKNNKSSLENLKTVSDPNCRREKHSENSGVKDSFTNRLIAKIKIPHVFKQQSFGRVESDAQQHVINSQHKPRTITPFQETQDAIRGAIPVQETKHASRTDMSLHETKYALKAVMSVPKAVHAPRTATPFHEITHIPKTTTSHQDTKHTSQSFIKRPNGIIQSSKPEINGIIRTSRKGIKDMWSNMTQKAEVPPKTPLIQVETKKNNFSDIRKCYQLLNSRTNNSKFDSLNEPKPERSDNNIHNSLENRTSFIESFSESIKPDDYKNCIVVEDCADPIVSSVSSNVENDGVTTQDITIETKDCAPMGLNLQPPQDNHFNCLDHSPCKLALENFTRDIKQDVSKDWIIEDHIDSIANLVPKLSKNPNVGNNDIATRGVSIEPKDYTSTKFKRQLPDDDIFNCSHNSLCRPTLESFTENIKQGDPKNQITEDHFNPVSSIVEDNDTSAQALTNKAKDCAARKKDFKFEDEISLDTICKIAEDMLLNIGILPSVSAKLLKEGDEPVLNDKSCEDNSHKTTVDTSIVKNKQEKENILSNTSLSDASAEGSSADGGCATKPAEQAQIVKALNGGGSWSDRPIPRICIQQHSKGLKISESDVEEDLRSLELEPLFIVEDGRQCCAGNIRYLTPTIEEECEDLTSAAMTPHTEAIGVNEYNAYRGRVETELQKVVLLNEIPARIDRGPQSVTVLRGESVTLAIHFAGIPAPDVVWIKGGTILIDGGRNSIIVGKDMSILTVSSVTADDSGKYVVCVENEGGGDSCFASVAVVGFPEPPGGEPTASDFTDHSLVLSWYGSMYDGGSVVTGYVVEMCLVPDRKWQRVASCENTSYVVQGLSCGQRYIFRVRAENKYGVSYPSRESQTVCLDDYLGDLLPMEDEVVEQQSEPVAIEVGSQFSDKYEMKEEVGKGRFGTVYRCIEVSTGRPRAAKVIRCIKVKDKEKVRQEVDIMNSLRHAKLLRILAAFESGRNMIMITEYISGGELFERVIADDFILTESDCVIFMRQICDGVAYMHKNSVIHLDLKPENILCRTRTSHQIKIIDFGLARIYDEKESLRILFGTPEFVAPEVIGYEPVGPASDMWSVGVICYVLLSGLSPFMGDTDSETFANITRGEIDFDEEAFLTISQDAKTFISSLLIKKPNKRMSAEDCLKHVWLERATSWIQSRDHPISTAKLKKFIIRRKWQKSGTAIRALGRMVSLSRSSAGSSCESPSPSASPTSGRSRSLVSSRSETNESGDSEVFPDTESIDLSR